jgi:hypothetical protein
MRRLALFKVAMTTVMNAETLGIFNKRHGSVLKSYITHRMTEYIVKRKLNMTCARCSCIVNSIPLLYAGNPEFKFHLFTSKFQKRW